MIKTASRLALLLAPVALLSACGGGSTTSLSEASFSQLEDRGLALADRFETADVTTVENMPVSGTASYSGVAAYMEGGLLDKTILELTTTDEASLASAMQLNANFSSGTIDGAFTNFQSDQEGYGDVNGRINIRDGEIFENQLIADLDGTIDGGGERGTITGVMGGAFLGRRGQGVGGAMDMVFTDTGTGESLDVTGVFIGEQD